MMEKISVRLKIIVGKTRTLLASCEGVCIYLFIYSMTEKWMELIIQCLKMPITGFLVRPFYKRNEDECEGIY
jgi:hypothetical protein